MRDGEAPLVADAATLGVALGGGGALGVGGQPWRRATLDVALGAGGASWWRAAGRAMVFPARMRDGEATLPCPAAAVSDMGACASGLDDGAAVALPSAAAVLDVALGAGDASWWRAAGRAMVLPARMRDATLPSVAAASDVGACASGLGDGAGEALSSVAAALDVVLSAGGASDVGACASGLGDGAGAALQSAAAVLDVAALGAPWRRAVGRAKDFAERIRNAEAPAPSAAAASKVGAWTSGRGGDVAGVAVSASLTEQHNVPAGGTSLEAASPAAPTPLELDLATAVSILLEPNRGSGGSMSASASGTSDSNGAADGAASGGRVTRRRAAGRAKDCAVLTRNTEATPPSADADGGMSNDFAVRMRNAEGTSRDAAFASHAVRKSRLPSAAASDVGACTSGLAAGAAAVLPSDSSVPDVALDAVSASLREDLVHSTASARSRAVGRAKDLEVRTRGAEAPAPSMDISRRGGRGQLWRREMVTIAARATLLSGPSALEAVSASSTESIVPPWQRALGRAKEIAVRTRSGEVTLLSADVDPCSLRRGSRSLRLRESTGAEAGAAAALSDRIEPPGGSTPRRRAFRVLAARPRSAEATLLSAASGVPGPLGGGGGSLGSLYRSKGKAVVAAGAPLPSDSAPPDSRPDARLLEQISGWSGGPPRAATPASERTPFCLRSASM